MAQINVLGDELQSCSRDPMTGYYRTGCCENHGDDPGLHVVCVVLTDEFLEYSKAAGNDLSTPMPQYGFAGLHQGEQWCLCASRWGEAERAGVAPPVVVDATHASATRVVAAETLKAHALGRP